MVCICIEGSAVVNINSDTQNEAQFPKLDQSSFGTFLFLVYSYLLRFQNTNFVLFVIL